MVPRELFQPRLVRGDGITAPNVLVVDDNDANLVALEAVLSSLKCHLVYARSGSEALAHLLREEFALILMDVQMPGMDGYETARLVRARRKTQHVPIIFLTAHDYDATGIKRAYDLGAVDFLPKPLDVDVLRAKAQAFIALYERTLEVAELRAERALIEERARQESEQLARDMARFVEADRRNTELLALLADELHAPLEALHGSLPDAAVAEVARMKRVVDELRDVTRIAAGAMPLDRTCVDLGIVVERALDTVRPRLDAREITLTLSPASEAIAVEVDVARIAHALVNVLDDAARVTPPGGTITIAWGREFGHAFVKVADTAGQAHLDRVFDLFSASERNGGLNLSLALAKQLVDLHRGTLLAAGSPTGTTFELRLPASEFPLEAARNRQMTARQRAMVRPRVLRVLIVAADDEAGEVTTTLLIGRGHQVTRAPDARTALAVLADQRPDVALIDLALPDGCEIVRLASALEPPLGTRFVAITDGSAAEAERATAGGFAAQLSRPLVTSAIVLALEAE
ncbi:MAG: response regulator [Deltaproteobacteria bacterium]|nr:response regulator [Deltaproteobacteria bacterium]